MADAGKVGLRPRGDWSAGTAYEALDIVRFDNKCWISKKSSTGVTPTVGEYWMLAVENVSQTQIDNIINGTTIVGNSAKLTMTDTVTGVTSAVSIENGIITIREA